MQDINEGQLAVREVTNGEWESSGLGAVPVSRCLCLSLARLQSTRHRLGSWWAWTTQGSSTRRGRQEGKSSVARCRMRDAMSSLVIT